MSFEVKKIFEDLSRLSKVHTKKEYEAAMDMFRADRFSLLNELVESNDYADTDLRSVIEGDSRNYKNQESFADSGYTTQEFDENEELVNVEEEEVYEVEDFDDDNFDDDSE